MAGVYHAFRIVGRTKVIQLCQARHMSKDGGGGGGGKRNFIQQVYENYKEGVAKNKEMKENLTKFREEREKLEQSEALKKARQKFKNIEQETSKTGENVKKTLEGVKGVISEKLDDVSKTEYVKKGMQMTEELGKTAGKAAETITKTGQAIGQSAPVQVSAQFFRDEFKDIETSRLYCSPVTLMKRSDFTALKDYKVIEENTDVHDVVLHKDSKWSQSWQNIKDNSTAINKMYEYKMKYDESEHIVARSTKFVTDKVTGVFGKMFTASEMSEVVTEISKVDTEFSKDLFIRDLYKFIIPHLLEAMVRGDLEVLKDWCFEGVYNVLTPPIEQAIKEKYIFDCTVLDVSDVDVLSGMMMEQGPVLNILFHSQQIRVMRNSKGEIVEGDPNKVLKVTYIWAMCRDQEEYDPRAAWKLIDMSSTAAAMLW